jgi:hypothetical protein
LKLSFQHIEYYEISIFPFTLFLISKKFKIMILKLKLPR